MRNIALGRGSTTPPSTSMAPSFFPIPPATLALPATSARAKSQAASTLGAASAPATKRENDLGNSENSTIRGTQEPARVPHRYSTIPGSRAQTKMTPAVGAPSDTGILYSDDRTRPPAPQARNPHRRR